MEDDMYARADGDVKDKAFTNGLCPHLPNMADVMTRADAGHALSNYEKVLKIGLNGIKKEIEFYRDQNNASYNHFYKKKKANFYDACMISMDGAEVLCDRYAVLATEMAEKRRIRRERQSWKR